MKRVRSIFGIFTVFLLIILASFLLLSWQSTANLKASLIQTAQLQTKYAATLLEQKGKEIEIEADGILYGENMQNLYAAIENNDVYEYVQQINKMKAFSGTSGKNGRNEWYDAVLAEIRAGDQHAAAGIF